jgi:hypothetical protein
MGTTIDDIIFFDAMPNDPTTAVFARWGEGVDGTFKTIVSMGDAEHGHLEGFVIAIAAHFANIHGDALLCWQNYLGEHKASGKRGHVPNGGLMLGQAAIL